MQVDTPDMPILDMLSHLQYLIFTGITTEFQDEWLKFIDRIAQHDICHSLQAAALLQKLLMAYQDGDYLLLADLLEVQLIPLIITQNGEVQ